MATKRPRRRNKRGKFTIDAAELEARRAQVVKLHVDGYTFREIGRQLEINEGTAYRDYAAVMDRTRAEANASADDERRVSLERISRAMVALMPQVDSGDLDAMDRLDKLERNRASLLGLNAPAKQEITGKDGAPIAVDARAALTERLSRLISGESPAGTPSGDPGEPHRS